MEPKNGLYVTSKDYEQFQDWFSNLIITNEEKKELFPSDSCAIDPDLKVKNITFVVTSRCQLSCTYCYLTHKSNKVMTKEIAKEAVDFIMNEEKINGYYNTDVSPCVILEFIGGEPLLEIDLIDYIVEYFKFKAFELDHPWAINYMISISTNGILYKSSKVQNFLKRNAGRVSIGISIDGNKELHDSCRIFPNGQGSYDIVEDAVKLWVTQNSKPQTKLTISPDNVNYLFDAITNVWSLGVNGVFANCVFEEGWTVEHAKILYDQMIKLADYILDNELYKNYYVSLFDEIIGKPITETRNWCGGNGSMLAIGTDGKCFPCIRFMEYSLSTPGRKEQPVGDIYQGLDKREENEWLCKLKEIDMVTQSPEKCLNCQIAMGCSLCTGFNYDKFGDPNIRATYICQMHIARVLANYYYWNKLYKKLELKECFPLNIPEEWALEIIDKNIFDDLLAFFNGGD